MRTYATVCLLSLLTLFFLAGSPFVLGQSSTTPDVEAAVDVFVTDKRVSGVEATSTYVTLTYPINARLLGIFPLALKAEVRVDTDGSFNVDYPWYTFLFSTDQALLQTKLEAVGKAAVALNTETLNAEQQVTLLALLRTALESTLESGTTSTSSEGLQ